MRNEEESSVGVGLGAKRISLLPHTDNQRNPKFRQSLLQPVESRIDDSRMSGMNPSSPPLTLRRRHCWTLNSPPSPHPLRAHTHSTGERSWLGRYHVLVSSRPLLPSRPKLKHSENAISTSQTSLRRTSLPHRSHHLPHLHTANPRLLTASQKHPTLLAFPIVPSCFLERTRTSIDLKTNTPRRRIDPAAFVDQLRLLSAFRAHIRRAEGYHLFA